MSLTQQVNQRKQLSRISVREVTLVTDHPPLSRSYAPLTKLLQSIVELLMRHVEHTQSAQLIDLEQSYDKSFSANFTFSLRHPHSR